MSHGSILFWGRPGHAETVRHRQKDQQLLEELATYHGGNRSMVVRHAIQVYSDMEDRLEEIETNPAFQAMMAKSSADIKAGASFPTRK